MRHHLIRLTRPRTAAAAALTGAVLLLAGCGNQPADSSASSASPKESSSQDAAADKTDGTSAQDTKEIFAASYQAAVKAGTAHVSMKGTGAQQLSAEGDVSYSGGTPAMAMTMKVPGVSGGSMAMRLVGGTVYMQLPGMTPVGKFVAFDPKDTSSPLSKSFGSLSSQMDPLSSLNQMEKAVKSLEKVGQDEVDGVTSDHYKVTVDTAKLMAQMGQKSQVAGMPQTLTYDVWVDGKDLMRKMVFEVAGLKMDMRMTKWGEPVHVEKPAARDLVKLPKS